MGIIVKLNVTIKKINLIPGSPEVQGEEEEDGSVLMYLEPFMYSSP